METIKKTEGIENKNLNDICITDFVFQCGCERVHKNAVKIRWRCTAINKEKGESRVETAQFRKLHLQDLK